MRKIVTEWMLDVCMEQHCTSDVFLLAANIMDRFLETVKLKVRGLITRPRSAHEQCDQIWRFIGL